MPTSDDDIYTIKTTLVCCVKTNHLDLGDNDAGDAAHQGGGGEEEEATANDAEE